jgi:hypothetical protein
MRLVRTVINILVILAVIWGVLVFVLPWAINQSPALCEKWKLKTGICGENSINKVKSLSDWAKNNLPWAKKDFNRATTLDNAYKGLTILENAARGKLGNEKVDIALNNVDSGIKNTEIVLNKEGFGDKLHDVPANAQRLVAEAKSALDRLRGVFEKTQQKTEDVTKAVDDTKKALDALSSALPSSK